MILSKFLVLRWLTNECRLEVDKNTRDVPLFKQKKWGDISYVVPPIYARATHARRNPLPIFHCVTFIRQAILNSRFALFVLDSQTFANILFAFRMDDCLQIFSHYKCLAIDNNILRCLRKCCENNKNMLS